jgi:hypothetical protein
MVLASTVLALAVAAPSTAVARARASRTTERNSPSRWRFRPLSPLTFRFRVEPSGWASTYSRSVLGARRNLGTSARRVNHFARSFVPLSGFLDRYPGSLRADDLCGHSISRSVEDRQRRTGRPCDQAAAATAVAGVAVEDVDVAAWHDTWHPVGDRDLLGAARVQRANPVVDATARSANNPWAAEGVRLALVGTRGVRPGNEVERQRLLELQPSPSAQTHDLPSVRMGLARRIDVRTSGSRRNLNQREDAESETDESSTDHSLGTDGRPEPCPDAVP